MPFGLSAKAKGKAREVLEPFPEGIKIWHEPEANVQNLVDIVFVHGLTGDRERTWTHPHVKEPWPKRLLPGTIPNARLMTYGYDAYVIRKHASVSSNRIRDHANHLLSQLAHHRTAEPTRRLIFVAHSLGGLVCKDALLVSKDHPQEHLQLISKSCTAIAFMGTPHLGSTLASWAKIPASALSVFKTLNTDLLSVLETTSEVLSRLQEDFEYLLGAYAKEGKEFAVTCFYEALPIPRIGTIVPRESARIAREGSISMRANHRDMVRFKDADEPGFRSLKGELERWIANLKTSSITTEVEKRFLQSLAFVELAARFDSVATIDDKTCDWIFSHSEFSSWKTADTSCPSTNLLWVKGKPGSGKSTIMKKLVSQLEKDWKNILLVSHFFNARGNVMEKSVIGLYRTLLHQILKQSKEMMKLCLSCYQQKEDHFGPSKLSWRENELASLFRFIVYNARNLKLVIVIDALDECEDEEVQRFLSTLEECAKEASNRGTFLKMVWSSRYYPHICVHDSGEIHVEQENHSAIKEYVEKNFLKGRNEILQDLRAELAERASGIFLWCELVVKRLEKAWRVDLDPQPQKMRKLLMEIPPKLEELYETIISDLLKDEDTQEVSLRAFQIALYAFERLQYDDFYTVLKLTSPAYNAKISISDITLEDDKAFNALITEISGGLLELSYRTFYIGARGTELGVKAVQVIHESVRDFFKGSRWQSLINIWIPVNLDFEFEAQCLLAKSCIRIFELEDHLNVIRNFRSYHEVISGVYRTAKRIWISHLSFLNYVSHYMFAHLRATNAIATYGKGQKLFGTSITWNDLLKGWILILHKVTDARFFGLDTYLLFPDPLSFIKENHTLFGIDCSEQREVLSCLINVSLSTFFVWADNPHLAMYSWKNQLDSRSSYLLTFWIMQTKPQMDLEESLRRINKIALEDFTLRQLIQDVNSETKGYSFSFRFKWNTNVSRIFFIPPNNWQILRHPEVLFPEFCTSSFSDWTHLSALCLLLRENDEDSSAGLGLNPVPLNSHLTFVSASAIENFSSRAASPEEKEPRKQRMFFSTMSK